MNNFNNLLKDIKNHDIILGIILIIYILGGYQTPHEIAPFINNFMGYVIMIVIFVISLRNSNLLLSILLGIGFIVLVQRSGTTHPVNVMPSQNYRDAVMNNLNQGSTFNSSLVGNATLNNVVSSGSNQELEELMVTNMATVNYRDEKLEPSPFKPTMSNNNNAFELVSE
jgi:hypothetical protein